MRTRDEHLEWCKQRARQQLILSAIAVLIATPAQACHRFSVWKYPYAQRCAVVAQVTETKPPVPPEKPLPAFTVSKYDTIILTPVPGRTDEEGRADAIRVLKEVMGK